MKLLEQLKVFTQILPKKQLENTIVSLKTKDRYITNGFGKDMNIQDVIDYLKTNDDLKNSCVTNILSVNLLGNDLYLYICCDYTIEKHCNKFVDGEAIIYQNGNEFELGIVKHPGTQENTHFVNYHTGYTAACTNEQNIHKISNLYAFDVIRKSCD